MTLLTRVGLIGATAGASVPPVFDEETLLDDSGNPLVDHIGNELVSATPGAAPGDYDIEVTFTGDDDDPWPSPWNAIYTSPGGGVGAAPVVIGLHGYQGGSSQTGGFGSGRDYPVSTGGEVAFTTETTSGPWTASPSGRAWSDNYSVNPRYVSTEYMPILDAAAEGATDIWLHGFSDGAGVVIDLLRNGETFDGRLRGVVLDDPADALGTYSNPAGTPVVLYATTADGGSTWNANTNNGFDVLTKVETAFGVTRLRSDTQSPAGPTTHAPYTRLSGTGPYAPAALLEADNWGSGTTGSSATIQSNKGRLATGDVGGGADAVVRGITVASQDYEITVDVTVISTTDPGYARVAWRRSGDGSEYSVSIPLDSDEIVVSEWDATPTQTVKGSETSVGITDGTVVHFRIRADGNDHKVRWWLDAESEPGTWNVEFTDSTLTTGYVGVYLLGESVSVDVDNFTLTYIEGSTPPPDESISVDFTGTNGDPWPAQLAAIAASTGATATIQSNKGRLTTGTLGGYSDSIFRGFTPTSQNYEITVDTILVNNTGTEGYARLAWRQQTNGAEYAASVALGSGNVSVFEQDSSYAATVRAQQTAAVATSGQVVHWKVRAEGTAHKAKWWIGAATEPSGWNAEFTDSSLTDGRIVLYLNGGSGTTSVSVEFDNFTVTYLDEEEPEPTGSNTLPTALSSTHGNERTLIFSSRRNIWNTTNFGNEVQRYTDDGIAFSNGGTSMVMTADDGAATATGYKSGATNNYDANISPVTPGSYIQWRVKMPVGQGFWPAIWMMPSGGGSAFEVDAAEGLGQPDRFDMNQHFDWNGSSYNQSFGTTIIVGDVTEWHNIGAHLHANRTDYYVDGVLVWSVPRAVTVNMAVAINFALGGAGSYPGSIDGTTPFPSTFEVESVKVWTATGSGGGSGGVRGVVSLAGAGGGKGAYNMGSGCDHPRGDFQTRDTWGNGSGGTTWDASQWASGRAIIEEAAQGLGQFIIHGFSIGGMFAQEVVHRGETFGGRLKGVVIDDPARNWGTTGNPLNPAGFVNPAGLPIALYGTRNAGNTAWFVDEFYSDFGYMQRIADAYGVTLKNSAAQPSPYTAPGVHRPNTRSNNGTGPNAPYEIASGIWWT